VAVPLGKTINAISRLGAKQSTRCGGPAWWKTYKQNSFSLCWGGMTDADNQTYNI